MLEIRSIPGCHCRAMGACDSCNHGIELGYRAANRVSRGCDSGKRAGCILIEGQYPALKLRGEQLLDGRQQSYPALARRQRLYAVQNFRLSDRRREHGRGLLRSEPMQDCEGRQGLERFREHVRVEYYHLASFSGRRTASRGGSVSSTPPSGSTYRRIDSARLSRGRRGALRPALRISRASSSIDLPWPAARRRSFVLTASSRRRIVMLAIHR